MKRTFALLVAAISAAVLLSGCGSNSGPAAAKVGTTTITRSTLDDELSALASNKTWLASLSQSWGTSLAAPEGGVRTQLSSAWLNELMTQVVVDKAFARRDLTVTDADRATAKEAALGLFGDAATFAKLPRWFQNEILKRQQHVAALDAVLPDLPEPTETQLQALFTSVSPQMCPTSEAIAQILLPTKEEADAVAAELAAGGDFATLAEQRSQDKESAKNGGIIACKQTTAYQNILAPLRDATTSLAVGTITPPVQTEQGWSVLKVVRWDFPTAQGVISDVYKSQAATKMTAFTQAALVKSKIWVDPRYGKVERNGGRVSLTPPKPPDPKSNPPTASTATAQ